MNRMLLGYNPDFDAFDAVPIAARTSAVRAPPVFNNIDAMSLAIDLLEVNTKPQLNPAVRRIVRRATQVIGRPLSNPVAMALSNLLETAVRVALPDKGTGLAAAGSRAPAKARFFGLELEGLSPEDQEFETAKAFVRFAGEAVRRATSVPDQVPPRRAALMAAMQSARWLAPGWPRMATNSSINSAIGPDGSNPGAMPASIFQGANHA